MSPEAQASLLDALSTALAIIDPRGEIEYLNASAQTLIAVGINQARGRHLFEFLRDAEPIEAVVGRARDGGEPIAYRELRLVPTARADSQFVVDCTASMLDAERVLLEISDTTRQQRISRDNALLAQLGGNRMMVRQLAHEIKNPLGGLRGAAQLLERELPAEPLKEYTRLIIREADRLRTLVDNLLGPGGVPHKTDVNPHEMLQHVFQLLRNEAPTGVQIVRDYDPSLPTVHVDRDQMIQAMLADSITELWAARLMTYEAAAMQDRGEDLSLIHTHCSMAKLYASEMANRVADRVVQIFGGRGYMRSNAAQRFYRELRVDRIWEGTSEIQRIIIARSLLKRGVEKVIGK